MSDTSGDARKTAFLSLQVISCWTAKCWTPRVSALLNSTLSQHYRHVAVFWRSNLLLVYLSQLVVVGDTLLDATRQLSMSADVRRAWKNRGEVVARRARLKDVTSC